MLNYVQAVCHQCTFFSAQFCDQGREESSISNGTHAVNGRASVSGQEDPHEEGNSVCVRVYVYGCVCCTLMLVNVFFSSCNDENGK